MSTPMSDIEMPLVTRWLTDHQQQLTPHAVARALRDLGYVVGDSRVLDVHDLLLRQQYDSRTSGFTAEDVRRLRAALRFHAEGMVAEAADDPDASRFRELHAESQALWALWETLG